ncbi:MAG: serine protease DegQ [Phenylobacterium sp.]|jgi:serine protease DegQ
MISVKNTTRSALLLPLLVSAALALSPISASAQIPMSMLNGEVPSLAPMLEGVTPAVVRISVSGSKKVQQQVPEALRHFFGQRGQQEKPFQGLGSGVIIDAKGGYVVTNYHVIDDADEILVTLKDGSEYKATKVGGDQKSDIALLQIDAKNLVEIKLADSDKLRVGDFTVAIGNPFGLTQTVTSGIISALGRAGLNIEVYEDFIQTDAAINSGNSGGALINLKGELIGINTAIYAPGGGNVGIAFSIPSNMMKSLVNQILDFGEVRRGILGISGGAVTAGLAESFGLSVKQGAFIREVFEDSAAAAAGLQPGDVIVKINGVKIKSFSELAGKIGTMGEGAEVRLGLLRENKFSDVTVKLQASDVSSMVQAETLLPQMAGAILSNGETRDSRKGVVVSELDDRSPAAQFGLEKDDVIIGVNRKAVSDMAGLRLLLKDAKGVIALNIRRGRSSLYLLLR